MEPDAQTTTRFSLRRKMLLLFIVLSLVPLGIYSLLSINSMRDAMIQEAGNGIAAQAQSAMTQLQADLFHAQENVRAWSRLPAMQVGLQGENQESTSKLLRQYRKAYGVYESLVLANSDGVVLAADNQSHIGKNVSSLPWFFETQSQNRPIIGNFNLDSLLDSYGVAISAPVAYAKKDGEVRIGVLSAYYSWQEMLAIVDRIPVAGGGQNEFGFALLVDKDGFILAAPEFLLYPDEQSGQSFGSMDQLSIQINQLLPELNKLNSYRISTLDQEDFIVAHSQPLSELNGGRALMGADQSWRFLIFRHAENALSAETVLKERLMLLGILTIAAVILLATLVSKRLSAPIIKLTKRVRELDKGNLNVSLKVASDDEVGELANAFDHLRNDVKHFISDLSGMNVKYQELVDSVAGIVWEADIHPFRYTFINKQIEQLVGYTSEWMRSESDHWQTIIHPEDRSRIVETINELELREEETRILEYRIVCKSGNVLWLKNYISGVHDQGKCVGLRGVAFDMSDVKVAEVEMQKARDIALKSAQSRSEFLAIMSHELRTPVNGMLGMLELMDYQELGDKNRQRYNLASSSGKQLLHLLDDILDYTKLENGQMTYEFVAFDLREFMEDVLSLMAAAAFGKRLDIGLVLENSIPRVVKSDPTRIRQVLVNLISNAIKFTNHGSIWVWAEVRDENRLYVEVKDTGIGVSPAQKETLFEPFVLVDATTTRNQGGSGLGLFLCRKILDGLSGDIGVNAIQNVGSSFFFELPIEVISQQTAVPAKLNVTERALAIGTMPATEFSLATLLRSKQITLEMLEEVSFDAEQLFAICRKQNIHYLFVEGEWLTDQVVESWLALPIDQKPKLVSLGMSGIATELLEKLDGTLEKPICLGALDELLEKASQRESHELINSTQAKPTATPLFNAKLPVLLVDDNPVNLKVAAAILKKLGFAVDQVENGQEAVDKLIANDYEMIFMDCQMPVMDGFEATLAIRELDSEKSDIPIIAVTANAMTGDKEKCLSVGMNDYLTKPIKKDALAEAIHRWLPSSSKAAS